MKQGQPGGREARMREARGRRAEGAGAAETVARCATLLRGGVAQRRILPLLAEEPGACPEVRRIAERVLEGGSPADAIGRAPGSDWQLLAAAWQLAEETGAPLAPVLERIASSLQALARLSERRAVLLAGPRATIRLVSALPLLAIGLAWLLGFDPLPILFSFAGLLMTVFGGLLLALGVAWAARMTRSLEEDDRVAGLELELVWIVLGGGAPPSTARVRVADCVDRLDVDWVRFDDFCRGSLLDAVLERGAAVGAPLGPLLLEEASAARARALTDLEHAAERLGVRVLIPLGVCVLPAFIVLGVLPVLIAMLSGSGF